MTFDALEIQNFGVYGGRQEILLAPEGKDRPIILFGGMNGGGKTTLLDAVQLAFYGPKARCSNRGKLRYLDYLRDAIHRGADPAEGASLVVRFRRAVDGQTRSYRVHRSWRLGTKGVEEHLDVMCDGKPDALLSEHWDEYIEGYIPSAISHLFFFDGEQIKELAEGEHAAELLGTAIHSLLGLDLVDRLEADLLALERRKKIAGRVGGDDQRLQHANDEVARLDELLAEATQTKAGLNGELRQLTRAVAECEERFRMEGGDLFVRRKDLEQEVERLEKELRTEEQRLRELAAGVAPLLLMRAHLSEVEVRAGRDAETRKARLLVNALEERDASVLEQLRESGMPPGHLSRLEAIFRSDRGARHRLLSQPCFIESDEHLLGELRQLLKSGLPEVSSRIAERLSAAAQIRERVMRAQTKLARIPEADAVAGLLRERETLRTAQQMKHAEAEAADAKLQVLIRQRQAAEESLERVLAEEAETQFGHEDRERMLKHSGKVRQTLKRLRTEIIRKHATRIERLMLEAFSQLLRKTSLVTDLKIDPETFRIELTGGDGRPLPLERLSAGERQLLATSLLWGLARASGRPLPTIIDTPLGRLDSSHRRHLVDRYFPVASHQVILLSTDEEVDQASWDGLKPFIAPDRSYTLSFDEQQGSTTIIRGYFWSDEATC